MKYQFPVIEHIDQVRAAIADHPEFVVAERDHVTVVNYNVSLPNTFGDWHDPLAQIRRECRGIKFDPVTGDILARPFHKFFNLSERPETQIQELSLDQEHWILEKLDGSMIHAIPVGNSFRFCTKMGVTDVSRPVEVFVSQRQNYQNLVRDTHELGLTAIFEWCSPQQRIVIDYKQDQLILTAVRETVSGEYWSYERLLALAQEYGVPVVQRFLGNVSNMLMLVEHTRGLLDQEGYVVRWADGHMIKIKADQYVLLHRTKDQIRLEKNLVDVLINDQADDLRPLLDSVDLARLEAFEREFWQGIARVCDEVLALYQQGQQYQLRRDYAVEFVNRQPSHLRSLLFSLRDGGEVRDLVCGAIRGSTGSQTRVDAARWMWGGASWNGSNYIGDN